VSVPVNSVPDSNRLMPPGLSAGEFAAALDALAAALGEGAVVRDEGGVAEFRDPYSFPGWDDHWPAAVVLPGSVEDVQAVVRIAGAFRIPLWTTSMGKNNAYGGPAPRVRGSVVVSMRRLNRVLEVNEELAYAVVEPGVSFFDLCAELRRRGSRLWASIPDLGWGSVIGNTLDHGVGYLPGGDHAASQCGMEVVLASGEVLRTGMGAIEGGRAWHAHRRGFGPAVDSLFMQSNFGIVTKMGKWLVPRPEVYAPVEVAVRDEAGLEALIDTTRELLLEGTVTNVPLIGAMMGAAAMTKPRAAWYPGEWHPGAGPIPEPALAAIRDELGMGWWNLRVALYGPEAIVDAQLARVRAAFAAGVPGATVRARKIAGQDVRALVTLIQPVVQEAGLDFWPGIILTPRSCYFVSPILYDTTNEAQARAAYDAYRRLVGVVGRAGYGLYRGHVAFMDEIAAQYGFGDHAMRRLQEALKDALDPGGILSPGKQGIWPRAMRPEREQTDR
jgi:4-cresol dehydrogenase (hydroxylating)